MVIPAGEGGPEGPTGSYHILSQEPTVLVQGAGKAVDAVTVTAADGVYGIVFQFTRSTSSWEGGAVQAAASQYASWIQTMATHAHVQAMTYSQGINAAGLLVDEIVVTVGTDDGSQAIDVPINLEALNTQAAFNKVNAAYDNLMAVANSTG